MPDDPSQQPPIVREDRKTIEARRNADDPFYDTPSWGLSRPGGAGDDPALQQIVAKTRRIQTYTIYQRSIDLPAVLPGAPLLQVLPRLPSTPIRGTAIGIISITLCLKSAVQAEFAIAECMTRGVPTSALTTYTPGVVGMDGGGWQPPQGQADIIAGYVAAGPVTVLGWSTAPTFNTLASGGSGDGPQIEQAVAPGTVGSSIQWLYGMDDPLVLKQLINDGSITPNGIVIWNEASANSPAIRATLRWMEFSSADAPSPF